MEEVIGTSGLLIHLGPADPRWLTTPGLPIPELQKRTAKVRFFVPCNSASARESRKSHRILKLCQKYPKLTTKPTLLFYFDGTKIPIVRRGPQKLRRSNKFKNMAPKTGPIRKE